MKLELSQKQLLSQKVIQSIEILQMSTQELNHYLNEVAMENPVIDLEAGMAGPEDEERLQGRDSWGEGRSGQGQSMAAGFRGDTDEATDGIGNLCQEYNDTLQDFLHEQLLTKRLDDERREIAEYIIGCLDSKGYFREGVSETARLLGKSEEKVGEALAVLKQLEPAGVCAADLQECLMNQLQENDAVSALAREMIANHLEAVGKNQIYGIAKKMKRPVTDVEAACDRIRLLNPKPGNSFSSRESTKYIIPDVVVVKLGADHEVLINDYAYPQISVEAYYQKLLKGQDAGEAADYIDKKIQQAEWIRQCIQQRNDTLLKVAKGIVQCQNVFFSQENGKRKTLKQADLAKILNVHESTVSRAIKDKYLQCSRGVFPMDFFFSKGIETEGQNGAVTVDTVKEVLARVIKNENRRNPYSDRMIAEQMNEEGIKISRRTVTKYRNEMGIKDVSGRKMG